MQYILIIMGIAAIFNGGFFIGIGFIAMARFYEYIVEKEARR